MLNIVLIITDIEYLAKDTVKSPDTYALNVSLLIFKLLVIGTLAVVFLKKPVKLKKVFLYLVVTEILLFAIVLFSFFQSLSGGGWAG
ncbi:MAG: hypothetical protein R2828_32875 [Saprospiraceae bacterium]